MCLCDALLLEFERLGLQKVFKEAFLLLFGSSQAHM